MKACKTPVCYVAKNTNLTHCHSPPTQLKLQEKGGTVTLGMQVRIRTNSVEFEFAPNSHEFVEPLEFEFEPKFLEIFCNHLEVHPFHPGGPVGR